MSSASSQADSTESLRSIPRACLPLEIWYHIFSHVDRKGLTTLTRIGSLQWMLVSWAARDTLYGREVSTFKRKLDMGDAMRSACQTDNVGTLNRILTAADSGVYQNNKEHEFGLFGRYLAIRTQTFYTAMVLAICHESINVVRRLLDVGVDQDLRGDQDKYMKIKETPGIRYYNYRTFLGHAIRVGSFEIMCLLLDRGAPFVAKYRRYKPDWTPLHLSPNDYGAIQGVNRSALAYAAQWRSRKMFLELLERGEDVNGRDVFERTPLHFVAEALDCIDVIDLMLKRGADPLVKDMYGRNLLHFVAECSPWADGFSLKYADAAVKRIVGLGVDIRERIPNAIATWSPGFDVEFDACPLDQAIGSRNCHVVRALLNHGAKIHGEEGRLSPLNHLLSHLPMLTDGEPSRGLPQSAESLQLLDCILVLLDCGAKLRYRHFHWLITRGFVTEARHVVSYARSRDIMPAYKDDPLHISTWETMIRDGHRNRRVFPKILEFMVDAFPPPFKDKEWRKANADKWKPFRLTLINSSWQEDEVVSNFTATLLKYTGVKDISENGMNVIMLLITNRFFEIDERLGVLKQVAKLVDLNTSDDKGLTIFDHAMLKLIDFHDPEQFDFEGFIDLMVECGMRLDKVMTKEKLAEHYKLLLKRRPKGYTVDPETMLDLLERWIRGPQFEDMRKGKRHAMLGAIKRFDKGKGPAKEPSGSGPE
ncbi:ankyrin repeat-containing domain protein [Stachybotrys elegans]|uniref:Ankyrin repeat-containing domain protein n=1 Tax=Stachybotrys elegans TaxID=80388 RepID=A0A8K0WXV0_9HYPO|nr:ankyrin repeat-containing domain protein [Stachybotrys elegans]